MSAPTLASIGDHGALNIQLSKELSGLWIDRDLSWLDFNQRVLAEAPDDRTPLLERAKFLAIFTSNLNEFFMKRIAVLRQGVSQGKRDLLQQLREKLLPMLRDQAECYRSTGGSRLGQTGCPSEALGAIDATPPGRSQRLFRFEHFLGSHPLVIDPEHPFPLLPNLSTSPTFRLQDPLNCWVYTRLATGRLKL
jgi:polyphosphate kinase